MTSEHVSHRNIVGGLVMVVALVATMVVSIAVAQQQATGNPLTGNWVARNPNSDGTSRNTYFNLKQEGSKIIGTIRATQFYYVIKESTGGSEAFTIIGVMQDGKNERRVQYEGKLVSDELHIGRRTRPDARLTEMIATRAPEGEGALPARI